MPEHRLRREIITTVVVNRFVNPSGITCFHRLSSETGAGAADVIRAHIAARAIFGAARATRPRSSALDHQVDAAVQTELRMEVRTLIERATRWLVNNRRRPVDIGSAVDQYARRGRAGAARCRRLLTGRDLEAYEQAAEELRAAGVPEELASAIAALPAAYAALTIVQTAAPTSSDLRRGGGGPLRPRSAARPGPAAGPDRRAAPRRPLADHGPGRAARRPAHGARPADRPGAGDRGRRPAAGQGPGGGLGEGARPGVGDADPDRCGRSATPSPTWPGSRSVSAWSAPSSRGWATAASVGCSGAAEL